MDGTVRYNINVTLWTVRYGLYGMDSKVWYGRYGTEGTVGCNMNGMVWTVRKIWYGMNGKNGSTLWYGRYDT